jgi:hypothetical protein
MADLRDETEVARVRAPAADDQEARDRLESYVLRLLDEARDEVKNADNKTNIVFATVTFVIGYLAAVLFDDSSAFRTGSEAATVVATISLGVFLIALLLLALAVTPRLGKPAVGKARYFQEQAQFPDADAMLQAIAQDAVDPVVRHSQQVHTLSLIARRKYQHLRHSMNTVALATLTLGIAALISLLD